jgi:GNAT superfamily N-acetyltransferase
MNNFTTSTPPQFAISIQEFSSEHTLAVGKLISKIQREEFEIPITLEQQPDLAEIPSFYQTGKGNFWIALSNQQVVGTISLLDIGNNQVALRKMFVLPECRGPKFGIARKLLESAFDWCRTKGVSEIYLGTTAKFLAAHRFYEKSGFVEITKANLPINFPVLSVDSKFYMLKV